MCTSVPWNASDSASYGKRSKEKSTYSYVATQGTTPFPDKRWRGSYAWVSFYEIGTLCRRSAPSLFSSGRSRPEPINGTGPSRGNRNATGVKELSVTASNAACGPIRCDDVLLQRIFTTQAETRYEKVCEGESLRNSRALMFNLDRCPIGQGLISRALR